MCVITYVCMCACVCVSVFAHVYVCVWVCTYVCMAVCACVGDVCVQVSDSVCDLNVQEYLTLISVFSVGSWSYNLRRHPECC